MILQENFTKAEWSFVIILLTVLIIIVIITVIIIICFEVDMKIHKSYHKGYNKAKSDKVRYYATIKTLIDNFDIIIENLKTDNIKPSIITTDLLLRYRDSLENYYND